MQHPFLSETPRLLYGADYNPEQWPESVWLDDMRLMHETGVNVVSIGIFSWARLQSAPGVFHFDWLDRLMDLLAEHGISADLATATASPPAWLIKSHPEILPVLGDGRKLWPGSRQHYNPSSQAYRAASAELVTALATRYKDHPALLMWHINNEYACHVPADYGDETAGAFRLWLRERYADDLARLNEAWGTAFWSQHYYAWEEILPPRDAPSFKNPGQLLDFQRFSSDALLECYLVEQRILREITPQIPVTTNFMEWVKPLDYRKWARHLDFTCLDIYPEPTGSSRPNAQNADMTRSFKDGAPWMIMEQVTTHVNWRKRNATKSPGLMRLWSYQSIAHGADGICFFQWRQSRAGAEKFHGAIVGHAEPPESQRCFREARELGLELTKLSEIAGSRVQAQAAIYFDQENWWALEEESKPNNDLKYARLVEKFYGALQALNITTDFVFADSDLSQYKLVFIPTLYLVKPGVAEQLEAFVRQGGQAVFTFFSGIVDESDRVLLGGYPAPFRQLLGLTIEEWTVPPDDRETFITTDREDFHDRYAASFWGEVIHLEGAEAKAHFGEDFFAGKPALTRHSYGAGAAWYLGTDPSPAFYLDLVRRLAADAQIPTALPVPDGVEVIERIGEHQRYVFFLNHSASQVEVPLGELVGVDLLSGSSVRGSIVLEPNGVAIIRAALDQP